MKLASAVIAALALTLSAGLALAHDLWIVADNPAVGQPLRIVTGYGHAFPADEGADKDLLAPAEVFGPQGKIAAQPGQGLYFVTDKPLAKGSYVAASGLKARWWTKTPEGYKHAPKNEVAEAVRCVRSVKYAKSIVNLGGAAGDVSQPVGQTLEVVPLANPAALKMGQELPVQILFEGKPLAGADVLATFAGFSQHKNSYAFFARADKDGMAYIKLWHPGLWVVAAKHKVPFKDQAKCDNYSHSATLTFEVK